MRSVPYLQKHHFTPKSADTVTAIGAKQPNISTQVTTNTLILYIFIQPIHKRYLS